jgi:cytochrome c peroxidase
MSASMNQLEPQIASSAPRRSRRYVHAALGVAFASFCAVLVAAAAAGSHADPALALRLDYRRPPSVPYPEDNAHTAERDLLGRMLFFDPRLSGSGWISCASCHNPGLAWSDALPRAIGDGMRHLGRRTPTIVNLAWAPALFWDGRADSLEQQATGPIEAVGEMNMKLPELMKRLEAIEGYRALFARAYPGEAISPATVGKALATFERGVVSGDAPFDRWVAGDDRAIPAAARRGFIVFTGKGRCSTCHTGWRFSDDGFYDIGVESNDLGRGKITPDIELSRFAFKTPTLRNVAERAPYLHDGSAATLESVIALYDRGGLVKRPSLSPEIKPLGLTAAEKKDLLAFLETLTSQDSEARIPALPR